MKKIDEIKINLLDRPRTWLITGVAGFIGSNILEHLLKLNQKVIGIDNFSTGSVNNLLELKNSLPKSQWENFLFYKEDICNLKICSKIFKGVDYVLHQAAIGSVSRSIINPFDTHESNTTGFLNFIHAAMECNVKSFTYASSSSVYGDNIKLPKIEENIGQPLSPYAVSKYANELYAQVYAKNHGFKSIGLRYFNVFGKRQNPLGAYAAVIPKWIKSMLCNKELCIYGDGLTSRDFCHVNNVVQANILATFADEGAKGEVYNIALGEKISLIEVYKHLKELSLINGTNYIIAPLYKDFRVGDISHSLASIDKAKNNLGYEPTVDFKKGLQLTFDYYLNQKNNLQELSKKNILDRNHDFLRF